MIRRALKNSSGVVAWFHLVGVAAGFVIATDCSVGSAAQLASQPEIDHAQSTKPNDVPVISVKDSSAKNELDLSKNLVVHYSFDEDDNGKVWDQSGNQNHAVTVGDVKYEPSFRGRAARFTSNKTYILSDAPGLNMHGWKQVSVSAWIKTKRYTSYARIINRGAVSLDSASGIALQAGSATSKASFSVGRDFHANPPIWEKLYSSSLEPSRMDRIDKWVHLVGTFDGERLRFYVDGSLDQEVESSGHHLKLWDRPNYKLVIGNSSNKSRMSWSDKYFDGLVDEVKIWRRSLSASEIKYIHAEGKKQKVDPLTDISQQACQRR